MLTLKVSHDEAQIIINALAAQPYHEVARLIPNLIMQAQQSEPEPEPDDKK